MWTPTASMRRSLSAWPSLRSQRAAADGSGFCPDRSVSRAEMAAFLSRAYNLPDGPDPGFADVPDDAWYAADVARLAASGITVGCGDGSGFCPSGDTTRAQMATFLHRAENRPGTEQSSEVSDGFVAVTANYWHACGLRASGSVECWGNSFAAAADVPEGPFIDISRRRGPWRRWWQSLRPAHRRHVGVLGPLLDAGCAGGHLHRHLRRPDSLVRRARRR